jgi:FixJ family two-component response regulator
VQILVVIDDDDRVREAVGCLIKSLGHAVETFASADEYLKSGRIHRTACLITDVQMSGMSGVDLRDRLVAEGHRTPIIFMTALPIEKHPAVEDGVVGILRKPLSVEQLIYALNRALGAALEPEATSNRAAPDLA